MCVAVQAATNYKLQNVFVSWLKKLFYKFLFLSRGFFFSIFLGLPSVVTQLSQSFSQFSSVQSVSEFLCVNSVASRDKKNWIEAEKKKKFSPPEAI